MFDVSGFSMRQLLPIILNLVVLVIGVKKIARNHGLSFVDVESPVVRLNGGSALMAATAKEGDIRFCSFESGSELHLWFGRSHLALEGWFLEHHAFFGSVRSCFVICTVAVFAEESIVLLKRRNRFPTQCL